ncbi:MAG: tetratricopeptide repeat protein [Chthoniobacteraceae bacterium]|nr:tetratricopeptide repeat protein [Chthoniobacteraceae bacterium]
MKRALLSLLALLWLPALAAGANPAWSVADAPYRIPVRLKTAPEVAEAGIEINIQEFGQTRPDLGDLLLTDSNGTPQPLAKIGRRTGGRVLLLAQKLEPDAPYFLYFGGGVQRQSPAWNPKTSLLMETKPAPDDLKFDSLASLQAAWTKTAEAPGATFVGQIFHGGNPFGLNANFLTHYSGYLRVPQTREITFYTLSSDCSFVVINKQEQLGWPGRHSPASDPSNVHKKAVNCPAGLVKIDYYAAKGDVPAGERLEAPMVFGWQLPDHFEAIPPEAWVHPGSAQLGGIHTQDGQPVPLPKVNVASFLAFGGQWLYETRFEIRPPQPAATGWTATWKFEDGAAVTGTGGTRILTGKEAQMLQCTLSRNGVTFTAPLIVAVPDRLQRASVNEPADATRYFTLLEAEPAEGLAPESLRARLALACEFGTDGQIARLAVPWLPGAAQKDPLWLPARLALLRTHAQTDPVQARQEFYTLCQTLDPGLQKPYADGLGAAEMDLLVFCLRDADAVGRLTQIAFQNPNLSRLAKIRIGDLHRLLGHYKEAAAQYQNLGARGRDAALAVKDSAASLAIRDLLERGFPRDAQEKLAEWEQRRPMVKFDGDFLLLRARTLLAFGRWTEALAELESFQKVQTDSPFQTDAQFYIARARYEKGQKEEARALWNAFLKDYPQHPLARQAKEWAAKP